MLVFKREGKIVESGIAFAPDFVCSAVAEYQSTVSLVGNSAVWQGTGLNSLDEFETWEISTVDSPK